ncbi:MAG: DUF4974 domain-containing protein [Pedobacter sp.]|nr:MAG: DUF4974 domain-containing protein [Pedobacter sp.]
MAQKPKFDPLAISKLVIKLINGDLNDTEQELLDEWLALDPKNGVLLEKLLDRDLWEREIPNMKVFSTEIALQTVLNRINDEGKSPVTKHWFPKRLWRGIAAAAILILLGSIFFFFDTRDQRSENLRADLSTDVVQQNGEVMLTLSDGRQVNIASLEKKGLKQGAATVSKKANGLNYQVDAANVTAGASTAYNTLTVPLGKQYQLTLPDGTEVWLNSKSSLTYPVVFNGNDRTVELSGEGYFEVARLVNKPFKVRSGNQEVQVLGTHFNIEAYPEDQKTVTTLVEGSVKVGTKASSIKIMPGQMAINLPSEKLRSAPANITDVLAWKNGLFSFNDDRIEDIMRKVARSYNMEVEFQGDVKDKRFWGVFPISKGLSSLLKNLEQTNTIHFKVIGRRIIVMP